MDSKEAFDKIKDMVTSGNLDEAKQFLEDHQNDLGQYADKAKDLLSGDAGDILGQVKGFFNK